MIPPSTPVNVSAAAAASPGKVPARPGPVQTSILLPETQVRASPKRRRRGGGKKGGADSGATSGPDTPVDSDLLRSSPHCAPSTTITWKDLGDDLVVTPLREVNCVRWQNSPGGLDKNAQPVEWADWSWGSGPQWPPCPPPPQTCTPQGLPNDYWRNGGGMTSPCGGLVTSPSPSPYGGAAASPPSLAQLNIAASPVGRSELAVAASPMGRCNAGPPPMGPNNN